MRTSEFAGIVLGVWIKGDCSPYMCDCIWYVHDTVPYVQRNAEELILYIENAGLSGFKLRGKFEDKPEELAEFRLQFLTDAIKHFESIND